MKWIGKRISFVEDKDKSTFVIYPERKPIVLAMIGAWFAMWLTIGGVTFWAWNTFELTQQEEIIVVIFLIFWAYYAQRVGRTFLWFMYGKEMLKINEAHFSIKRSIRGYGKAHQYFVDNIKKMSLHQPKEQSIQSAWEKSPWIVGGERIFFEYMGKQTKVGRKLDEKDAKLLFQMLTKRIEKQVRRNKKSD